VRAARLLRRALARLGADGIDGGVDGDALVLRAQILLSLSYVEVELGDVPGGLALLDRAAELAARSQDAVLDGLVHSQRGAIMVRRGLTVDALHELSTAVRILDSEPLHLCRALLNRGALHLYLGGLGQAETDLRQCVDVAARNDLHMLRVKAQANHGYLAFLKGDLPTALREVDELARYPVQPVDMPARSIAVAGRAEMLHAAGLTREASAELRRAIADFRRTRLTHNLGLAELALAQVALSEGRPGDARRWAGTARRTFLRRSNATWAELAELWGLQAQLRQGRRLAAVASAAAQLSGRLRASRLVEDSRVAALVAAQAWLAQGHPERAASVAGEAVRLRTDDRIGTRVQARLVRAELARDPRRREAELRGGLADLHRYQSRFGSIDLQTASALHGRQLAELGLADAVADGRPVKVFAWSERARALAARLMPVRPPEDPHAAELLAELRRVRNSLREAELAGRRLPELRRRRTELERLVRQRAWFAAGQAEVGRPARLSVVRAAVAQAGGCLVTYLVVGGRLHALVMTARTVRLVPLGPLAAVTPVLRRVRADLDAAALSIVPQPVRQVVDRSLAAGLSTLDSLLWRPLAAFTGDGPVVVVPTSTLAVVPWTCLPGTACRPLAVVPLATWWLAARSRAAADPRRDAVLATGPGVARSEGEVRAAAAVWPRATVLTGADATSATVLAAAGRARLLHVAAHGAHEPDNPLFSWIRLADGPLFGYDLPRAAALPTHVVLSACDLGLAEVRPGDEALGMTAALLHGGVASVVAGVGRVGDDVASAVMVAHHAALAAGRSPAVALADALSTVQPGPQPAPLVCFGAGW